MSYDDILKTMHTEFLELAGYNADDASDIGIRLKVLAAQLFALYSKCDFLRGQMFPQTATGEYLTMHGQTRGINRKEAAKSTGQITLGRENAANFQIEIPAGVICSVDDNEEISFITTESAVLLPGRTTVTINAEAVNGGSNGNISAGAVTAVINPPQGITYCSNDAAFSGGTNGESDDSLRERLLQSFYTISNSTNSAYYYQKAMEVRGVASAHVNPRVRGRGTVDVTIASPEGIASAALIKEVSDMFETEKEINVDVLVRSATVRTQNITFQVRVSPGYSDTVVFENIRNAILGYMQGLMINERATVSKLYNSVYGFEGVENVRITVPTLDVVPNSGQVIRVGSITIVHLP
jgi:uncharacterized phage protein gp47/JayE